MQVLKVEKMQIILFLTKFKEKSSRLLFLFDFYSAKQYNILRNNIGGYTYAIKYKATKGR